MSQSEQAREQPSANASHLAKLDDRELALNAQAGCLLSYEELVRRYDRRIFAFLLTRSPSRQDAEDLLQKTFIAAYKNIGKFKTQYPFSPWLYTIARNLAVSHLRRLKPHVNEVFDFSDERSPAHVMADRETRENLWSIVQRELSETQATALWLKYREQLPVSEIARTLGKSVTHTKVILHRARKALAKHLGAEPATDVRPPVMPEARPVFADVQVT